MATCTGGGLAIERPGVLCTKVLWLDLSCLGDFFCGGGGGDRVKMEPFVLFVLDNPYPLN